MFDIEPTGYPRNIRIVRCSEETFKEPSEKAVTWWFYDPEIRDGKPIWTRNQRTKITFKLHDDKGTLLPAYGQ